MPNSTSSTLSSPPSQPLPPPGYPNQHTDLFSSLDFLSFSPLDGNGLGSPASVPQPPGEDMMYQSASQHQSHHENGPPPMQGEHYSEGLESLLSAYGGGEFDNGLLQQLEHVHMQSPLIFNGSQAQNYQQMFMNAASGSADGHGTRLKGLLTPGPSGEMHAEQRIDKMSPIALERMALARGEYSEGMDYNNVPLLSPALSLHPGNSNFASPVFSHAPQNQLEQLQEQQRQFQEQLLRLQQQHEQLQASAAAVAVHISPHLQGNASASGSSKATASPGQGYFSPLTSPALGPTALRNQHQHQYAYSNGSGSRPPHPLSALSSPALNPSGFSGGAQQTLSPALGPQADSSDPEYLRLLVGMLDNHPTQNQDQSEHLHQDPNPNQNQNHHQNHNQNPNQNQTHLQNHTQYNSPSLGPIRGSLPMKSRPSPMMKPTTHRSHHRQSSSVTNSPLTFRQPLGSTVPPPMFSSASTVSTPSPVDLSHMMPPPPLPGANGRKAVVPMTPASLMNLGSGERAPVKKGKNVAAKGKKSSTVPVTPVDVSGKPGKRTTAIRPKGGVAVRAAKAIAQSLPPPEGEVRKTSHKAAEQRRRDSLKAGFDELRLLLPPINTEALDPETGEPVPGSSAPRLLPKSSLVPDDNPNRGVSKVALLRFSNEYIGRLEGRLNRRDDFIESLKREVARLRNGEEEGE
ncbi:hypothetical protein P7C73_g6496, partial [Tremellales sp. Uapishka_1]